ncbi:MAG: hypothetical protein ACF8PN_14770 [Phycisphaerales bacterium]
MTGFVGPIQAGLAGTTGAQEASGRVQGKREREKAERSRRFEDALEMRVSGVEEVNAAREVDSQDADRQRHDSPQDSSPDEPNENPDDSGPRLDVTG